MLNLVADEYATTRLWEYILLAPFHAPEWIRASQQPPTNAQLTLRRVDYIIEHMELDGMGGVPQKVLFMEAKRHAAGAFQTKECEIQAWGACQAYSLHEGGGRPCWYQTCIGTATRLWIYNPWKDEAIAFLPGAYNLGDLNMYLDIAEYGEAIIRALAYISNHHTPPDKFLRKSAPSISSSDPSSEPAQSPTTASRNALRTLASGQNQIPLDPQHWIHVEITRDDGSFLHGRCNNGDQFSAPNDASSWRVQTGPNREGCYVYIQPVTRAVFWTATLVPTQGQVHPGPDQWQGEELDIPVAGPSGSNAASGNQETRGTMIRVQATKKPGPTRDTTFWGFTDRFGNMRWEKSTRWKSDVYEGENVMVYQSKTGTRYFFIKDGR